MADDDIRRKRCEKLTRQGRACVREGDLDGALEVAAELERLRYTAGFEIAALAHQAKGDLQAAVAVLQRGVGLAPGVWLNWQLLGNCLSDLGRHDDAEAAYGAALGCDGCWPDSVRLNQAILANRRGRPERALAILGDVSDPQLDLASREARVESLRSLGRLDEALALAEAALEGGPPDGEEAADPWARLAAGAARIRLGRGEPGQAVRRLALRYLADAPSSPALLGVLREIEPRRSPAARHLRLLVHGAVPLRSPMRREAVGFYATYEVAADTPEQALDLVRALEGDDDPVNLSLDSSDDLGPLPDEPLGVLGRTGRAYYESDD